MTGELTFKLRLYSSALTIHSFHTQMFTFLILTSASTL